MSRQRWVEIRLTEDQVFAFLAYPKTLRELAADLIAAAEGWEQEDADDERLRAAVEGGEE